MRRSISAGPTCWDSGAGADRIRLPARRLERAAPGRLVHRTRIEAGIKSINPAMIRYDYDPAGSRFAESIHLSSYLANPLSKRQHQRADSDGCVGLYLN